jgi:hypothetical protein
MLSDDNLILSTLNVLSLIFAYIVIFHRRFRLHNGILGFPSLKSQIKSVSYRLQNSQGSIKPGVFIHDVEVKGQVPIVCFFSTLRHILNTKRSGLVTVYMYIKIIHCICGILEVIMLNFKNRQYLNNNHRILICVW